MMQIPFALPYITQDEIEAVVGVLKSNWLSMGPKTLEFEKMIAKYIGCKHAIVTDSCTSALFLSLKALGIKAGDEVITTTFTFASTANVIAHCNAKPVFVDIDELTYNIDINKIEEKITDKTRAVIVVHYGGQPVNMRGILNLAKKYNLAVIEDAAHAMGSEYENRKKVGSLGNLTCFSFYPTKPMTTGEGGAVVLNDDHLSERLRLLRLHGISRDAWRRYLDMNRWYYEVLEAGYKCNPTDIISAIGIEQLKKLDWMNEKRREIAEYYSDNLEKLDVILPYVSDKVKSSYHLYPIRLTNYSRDGFISEMAKRGIGTSVHFIPLHLMPYYQRAYGYRKGAFPIAERVYEKIVSLPIYPQLKENQLEYIVRTIKEILRG